ncbi:MAG TPA: hypothetical protein PKA64_07750 [Myxococcota bacterium]|nr:hypothetical protein [Myxococcota bacterium]
MSVRRHLTCLALAGCTGGGPAPLPVPSDPIPTDVGKGCTLSPATFDAWFESGAASLNGAVKPANGLTFPNTSNCSFYEWSEQMFLWLTSPAPARYGGDGLVLTSPAFYDVSLPDASGVRHFVPHEAGLLRPFDLRAAQRGILDLPLLLEKGTLRALEVIPPALGPNRLPLVIDAGEREVEVAGIRAQVGATPLLLDAAGAPIERPRAILHSATSDLIPPFERRLNELSRTKAIDPAELVARFTFGETVVLLDLRGNFVETEQAQADGSVLMAQNGSLVYYAITVNNVFAWRRTQVGATVPAGTRFPTTQSDLDAITAFAASRGEPPLIDPEALAMEIKTSWVEASSLSNPGDYLQIQAVVPSYDTSDPKDWAPNGERTVTLAMVGMHVVGSTAGHPELLWGTFEYQGNDPAAAYTYTPAGSGSTNVPQDTSGTWLFCASGSTGPFNVPRMGIGSGGHIVAFSGSTIGPTDILRDRPWGRPGADATSNTEVLRLNHDVRGMLDPADVRRRYLHVGTTWTINGAAPTSGNQVGTNDLSNTTMETYTQGGNCFDCHVTNTTVVSHVFGETAPIPP